MTLNLVDLVIACVLLIGVANGYRRGFWLSLSQYAGMVAGVVSGAALTPRILDALSITSSGARPWAALLILVVGGSLGSTIGYWLGEPIRRAVMRSARPGRTELVFGTVVSSLSVLLTCWFLGLAFDRGPSPDLARQVQSSRVLRGLDTVLPRPPGFLAGVERTLSGVPFPQTFAGLEPSVSQLRPPADASTSAVLASAAAVYRVEGRGCGGLVTGSAYPVAPGYFVTNAHVVAGTVDTTLARPGSGTGPARAAVVLFDPQRDVAVLHASGLRGAALNASNAARGTQGAVIGYPGGGDLDIEPAVVDSTTLAEGRDIYNAQLVQRNIAIVQALVRPGNSGGPLLDLNGRVLGMIFAASSSNSGQAYALTNAEIAPDVQQGAGVVRQIDTSTFACAV
ncbi:MAG: MarP family serine protease [Candidatus Dormibacteraeota bacterium]|nr:MarP family serine protease [Candidatus Dormibacteraeota bacterium]